MSGVRAFWDTNIFIYMFSENEEEKRQTSISLLDKYVRITSTQALNELSHVFTKKYKLEVADIRGFIQGIKKSFQIELITDATIDKALGIKERYGFAYYDCLMLSSALDEKCDIIFSEDMNNGQIIEGCLKIVNPFNDLK